MPYELTNRLVVGVASSALFDLAEADALFRAEGEEPYRLYQEAHIDTQLEPGVAFPFIQRLLGLNDLSPASDPLVEVIVLSKNDPTTGLRVMRSIASHELSISRAVFTQGKSPYAYIGAFTMSLFLSADEDDVRLAMAMGFPAGRVMESDLIYADDGGEVRVAFDFDGVLADDASERINQGTGGLPEFLLHEANNVALALGQGPLQKFLADLNRIQKVEQEKRKVESRYQPRLRISIVTARNAPAHERAVRTLGQWGVTVNDAFFLGGISKGSVLQVLRPHIFFDDQKGHLASTVEFAASVHIPYGISNESVPLEDAPELAAAVSGTEES